MQPLVEKNIRAVTIFHRTGFADSVIFPLRLERSAILLQTLINSLFLQAHLHITFLQYPDIIYTYIYSLKMSLYSSQQRASPSSWCKLNNSLLIFWCKGRAMFFSSSFSTAARYANIFCCLIKADRCCCSAKYGKQDCSRKVFLINLYK